MKNGRKELEDTVACIRRTQKGRLIPLICGVICIACACYNLWVIHKLADNSEAYDSIKSLAFTVAFKTSISVYMIYLAIFLFSLSMRDKKVELLLYLAEKELKKDKANQTNEAMASSAAEPAQPHR